MPISLVPISSFQQPLILETHLLALALAYLDDAATAVGHLHVDLVLELLNHRILLAAWMGDVTSQRAVNQLVDIQLLFGFIIICCLMIPFGAH